MAFITDARTKRSLYPLWLRFFALIAVFVTAIVVLGPSLLWSNTDMTLPWSEESRILSPDKTPHFSTTDQQVQLTSVLRYRTQPEQDGWPRGIINLLVYPNGAIKGVWTGEYDKSDEVHCLVMASSFSGNIDPSKPFIEDGVRNPSKLYFITTGSFTMLETQLSSGKSRSIYGLVYVCGWLDPDYTALAELTITENKKTFETFPWAARPIN
ncbi:MAG: hypothetical protein ABII09_09165 [Planctomycetota bacterium]